VRSLGGTKCRQVASFVDLCQRGFAEVTAHPFPRPSCLRFSNPVQRQRINIGRQVEKMSSATALIY